MEKASCADARVEIATAFLLQNWASRTCRVLCARVGVLEDVLKSAGGGLGSDEINH